MRAKQRWCEQKPDAEAKYCKVIHYQNEKKRERKYGESLIDTTTNAANEDIGLLFKFLESLPMMRGEKTLSLATK